MRNLKKTVAVLLSALLLASLFTVAVSAENGNFRITVKSNTAEDVTALYNTAKDTSITLSYNIVSDNPIMNTQGWLKYDHELLTLESFEISSLNNTVINTNQVNAVDFNSTEVTEMADFSKGGALFTAKFKPVTKEGYDSYATTIEVNIDELNANNGKDVPLISGGKIAGDFVQVINLSDPYSEPTTAPTTVKPTPTPKKKTVKKANTIKVKALTKTVKLKKLKKKNQTIKNALKVTKAKGKLSYKIVKKGTTAKIRKFVKINKKGVITFKKWKKAKKGTYKVKVTVTAAGNKSYKKGSKSATVKIKVKK